MTNDSENLKKALAPKSDQLNADDLISGPIDVVIRKVTVAASGEQRIALYYHGDNEKPYKPGKAMGRVIMETWGDEPAKWIAGGLRLFRDPTVKFGKDQVGGIRISHMTGIKETITIAVTTKKGERKPHIVKPLVMQQPQGRSADDMQNSRPDDEVNPYDIPAMQAAGRLAAAVGPEALKTWWGAQKGHHGKLGGEPFLNELKAIAEKPATIEDTGTASVVQNSDPAQTSAGDDEVSFDV